MIADPAAAPEDRATGRAPILYPESARDLVPSASTIAAIGEVTQQQPPPTVPGMVSVQLDPEGRLTGSTAVPPHLEDVSTDVRTPNWAALFAEAGLPIAQFSPTRPTRIPPVYAEVRAAWAGVYPRRREIPIRVEGAAAQGRPVYFEIVARGQRRDLWSPYVSPPLPTVLVLSSVPAWGC